MNRISTHSTNYTLKSPNGKLIAQYVGSEFGFGSPTLGNFVISKVSGEKLFSFPGFAPANFSDDSNYFIYERPSGSGSNRTSNVTVVEVMSGKEVWVTEKRIGDFSEVITPGTTLLVNEVRIEPLENPEPAFDISQCQFEER